MDYQVEEISPVKKKIQVTVATPEVNKAIDKAVGEYARNVRLPGFRKGKVPVGLIESRYRREVYSEAMTRLVDDTISKILADLKLKPASKLELDHADPERNQPFKFSLEFEIFPEFELPEYKGLKVEERRVAVDDQAVEDTLLRIRESLAEIVPVAESRAPKDDEVVRIDFTGYKNGEAVGSMTASNYQLTLGRQEAVPELEELVKTLKPGESGEKEITFSKDMVNKDIAGETLLLKVTLRDISERRLPELTEELAERLGAGTVERMRASLAESYLANQKSDAKEEAQDKLVKQLLEHLDYPLPESLVAHHAKVVEDEIKYRRNKGNAEGGQAEITDEEKALARTDAEAYVKGQILLLKIAEKEGLEVGSEEIERRLEDLARRGGMDPQALKQYYVQQNLIYSLRDRMLTEKALEAIYAAAEVTEVAAPAEDKKDPAKKKAGAEKKEPAEKKTPAARKPKTDEAEADKKISEKKPAPKKAKAEDGSAE